MYDVPVRSWISLTAGWGIAVCVLVGIAKLPGNALDLYFRDVYVAVSKRALVTGLVLVLVVPLAVATASMSTVTSEFRQFLASNQQILRF